jgi:hypothetical protein
VRRTGLIAAVYVRNLGILEYQVEAQLIDCLRGLLSGVLPGSTTFAIQIDKFCKTKMGNDISTIAETVWFGYVVCKVYKQCKQIPIIHHPS